VDSIRNYVEQCDYVIIDIWTAAGTGTGTVIQRQLKEIDESWYVKKERK
jgi:hypothetical protein